MAKTKDHTSVPRAKANIKTNLTKAKKLGLENDVQTHQRLDCIYDDEPLVFEKDHVASTTKMQPQDPLKEIDLGDGSTKMLTYNSANIDLKLKLGVINVLHEFKECFAWDYNKMPGLSRESVELKLPIKSGGNLVKQMPRRFV